MSRVTPSMAKNAIKRALRSIIDRELTDHEKAEIWQYFSSQCAYCGKLLVRSQREGHIDHLEPTASGGTNHISNRVLSCPQCNGDEKREDGWGAFLNNKISNSKTREKFRKKIDDWIEKHSHKKQSIDEIFLQQQIDNVCKAFDSAATSLKLKHKNPPFTKMKSPFVMRWPDESYGRVIEFVFPYISGGLCFLDVGRGLHSAMPPFHIIEGPVIQESDRWILSNGAVIQELLPTEREWRNWQAWLDFRESPDGVDVDDTSTIDSLKRNGAIIE